MNKQEKLGHYQVGLDRQQEAVISAHFMHVINLNSALSLYDKEEFEKKAYSITSELLFEKLVPVLLEASERFILERIQSAKLRARTNYKLYNLNSPEEVQLPEMITEIFLDRQFLKGPKVNYSQTLLHSQIKDRVNNTKPINMIIPALPYKSSSPLKTRGGLPDLSEVNFLLGLSEVARTIDYLYREYIPNTSCVLSKFTVVCDGNRFNNFTNEPREAIDQYQDYIKEWIKKLGTEKFIEITDYQSLIANKLPEDLKQQKNLTRKKATKEYTRIFVPLLDPYNMQHTFSRAIAEDPDPEGSNVERRFVPLFKSLIYIIRYKILNKYVKLHKKNYMSLYKELTEHIFQSYVKLSKKEFDDISSFITNKNIEFDPTQAQVLECLRCMMLQEAWNATIAYIAEIKSDRDLYREPILACAPDCIRWTIHTKSGQLAILTTTASGDPVQAWHGVGVFKLSQKNKIKLYALPVLSLEGANAIPIIINNKSKNDSFINKYIKYKQPLFYIYPDIIFKDGNDLIQKIQAHITRKRKF